jgi:hypothetical protein
VRYEEIQRGPPPVQEAPQVREQGQYRRDVQDATVTIYAFTTAMEQKKTTSTSRMPTASEEAIKKLQEKYGEELEMEKLFKAFELFALYPIKAGIFLALKKDAVQDMWLERQLEEMEDN